MKQYIGIYTDNNGNGYGAIYNGSLSLKEFYNETFSPDSDPVLISLTAPNSKLSYRERKAAIRDKALDWDWNRGRCDFSYGELVTINGYFTEMGRKYGLTKEFRENCII